MAGGRLLASADSGATWKTVRTDPALIGVSFPPSDRLKGWLVTSDGLLESVDAGTTWTPVPGTPRSVTWAQRIDAADGFALTAGNQLQRTTDGGATWVPVATPAAVVGACFVSPQLGLVTTSQPDVVVFRTDDGGASWHRSLERSSGAEYANLDCTPRIADVDIEYQSSMYQGTSEVLTSAGNDQWSSFWSNCNPPSCNPPGSGTSSQLAGKPDTTGRTPLVALTATGALAVYPADHAHSYVTLALSTDGAGMPRVANALVPQPANEVQDVIGFGAAFADARHGYVALLVMQADGRSIITVVQTTDGGVSWLATTLPL